MMRVHMISVSDIAMLVVESWSKILQIAFKSSNSSCFSPLDIQICEYLKFDTKTVTC